MSRQLAELEMVLEHLIAEHEKLLRQLESQQAAMKNLDVRAMEAAADLQEGARLRIASLETRRRSLVGQLATGLRLSSPATIAALAEAMPQAKGRLLTARERLRGLMSQIALRAQVAGRLAGAVLGQLNTVVRLVAGAAEQAGLYTKQGVPQVSSRIGMLEAVA